MMASARIEHGTSRPFWAQRVVPTQADIDIGLLKLASPTSFQKPSRHCSPFKENTSMTSTKTCMHLERFPCIELFTVANMYIT